MSKMVVVKEPDWVELSEEWKQSGLSQKKFCEQHGLSYSLFCYRRRELKKQVERTAADEKFYPVTVEVEEPAAAPIFNSGEHPAPEIEVELPFGVTLRFRGVAKP